MAGKGDVINEIAERAGISKKEAAAAFDAFVGYISSTCQSGERCAIPGLGSFSVAARKAREGRNPRTNEKITIPASKNVRFKAGKDLKEAVNTERGKQQERRARIGPSALQPEGRCPFCDHPALAPAVPS